MRELGIPSLPNWEALPESFGGVEERQWVLHDDGTLVAEYQDGGMRVQVDEGSTPSDSVRSFLSDFGCEC